MSVISFPAAIKSVQTARVKGNGLIIGIICQIKQPFPGLWTTICDPSFNYNVFFLFCLSRSSTELKVSSRVGARTLLLLRAATFAIAICTSACAVWGPHQLHAILRTWNIIWRLWTADLPVVTPGGRCLSQGEWQTCLGILSRTSSATNSQNASSKCCSKQPFFPEMCRT